MRGLILAIQFLTRLPTPPLRDFDPRELANSAPWFPWVGVLVGGCVFAATALGNRVDTGLGALLALLTWIWITGALHLDGLSDLADGLGAAHRNPERLVEVMRDPHVGSFGVIVLIAQILAKLVLLKIALDRTVLTILTLPLICAWARYGAILWSAFLPALPGSSTERFVWKINKPLLLLNASLLLAVTTYYLPVLLIAPVALAAWALFLHRKVGGMSGDCLGAGIEWVESGLLLVCVLADALWR